MNLPDIIKKRRSIRKYTADPIPEESLTQILEAGLLSPSSRSRRPWEFIVVTDPATLKGMSGCRVGSAKMLEHAKAAVVVIGNPELSDVWVEDCSIAMSLMHLTAASLGVGSCWIQCRLRQSPDGNSTTRYLRSLLHFPDSLEAEAILSLGMPDQHLEPQHVTTDLTKKIHYERY